MGKSKADIDLSYLDDEERELVEAAERGELKRSADFKNRKMELEQAARNSIRKKAINIRFLEPAANQEFKPNMRSGFSYFLVG